MDPNDGAKGMQVMSPCVIPDLGAPNIGTSLTNFVQFVQTLTSAEVNVLTSTFCKVAALRLEKTVADLVCSLLSAL
jgi:hypothetical protein